MGGTAEFPASRDEQPVPGLRASDAERDQVVARLREEFAAGRLSHDTFLYRVDQVLGSRRQADLPPLVADLPAGRPPGGPLVRWLRGTWSRVTGAGAALSPGISALRQGRGSGSPDAAAGRGRVRALTTSMNAAPGRRPPFILQFPRAEGGRFTIGRDPGCDLTIADMTVSRQHAQIERTADGWLLSDLESTNGTRLNGWRVRGQVPVRPGDLVSFGDLEVIITRTDELA